MSSSNGPRQPQPSRPSVAREQLERLYREIGIPALAAAVHMGNRPAKVVETKHEIPAILRDESLAA
jgi:hypothetical protein